MELDVIATVLKATFKLALTTVPQLRGLVLVLRGHRGDTKPAIDWIEKSTKQAKEFGLDPAKLIKKEPPKPPSVKELKGTVVTARDGPRSGS